MDALNKLTEGGCPNQYWQKEDALNNTDRRRMPSSSVLCGDISCLMLVTILH